MKKFIMASLVLFLASQTVQAQSLGVKAGLNMARITFGNDNYKTTHLPGFHAGFFLNYPFAEKMGAQLELLYSTEGTKETNKMTGSKFILNESFVQIPVLFQYLVANGIHVETGPQVGIVLSMKEGKEEEDDRASIKEYYKPVDIRWALGAGYQVAAVKGLGVNLRFSLSLTELNDKDIAGSSIKNQVFQLGVTYALRSFSKK